MCTSHEDLFTFIIISRSVFLRMRDVLHRFVEKMKTHICVRGLRYENPAVYEIMWKNSIEPEKTQTT